MKYEAAAALISLILLTAGCVSQANHDIVDSEREKETEIESLDIGSEGLGQKGGYPVEKNIVLRTEDGFEVYIDHYSSSSVKGLILLHQLSLTKESWKDFAEKAQRKGFQIVALDLRGHGKSIMQNGKTRTWESFTERDFNDMKKDISAARRYLEENGASDIGIAGASIGANLALIYAAENGAKTAALLSPGFNYRGLVTEGISTNKKIFITASTDDAQSVEDSKKLASNLENAELKIYTGDKHGTYLLSTTDLGDLLIEWFKANL